MLCRIFAITKPQTFITGWFSEFSDFNLLTHNVNIVLSSCSVHICKWFLPVSLVSPVYLTGFFPEAGQNAEH
jgi:hypothetical protein